MDSSLVIGMNRVAEIYNRPAFNPPAAYMYKKATGIEDEQQFFSRLFALCQTCTTFPLPAQFTQEPNSALHPPKVVSTESIEHTATFTNLEDGGTMRPTQPTFKFNLRGKVTIRASNETGEVRARSDNTSGENQYRVAYCNAQGVATEAWWCEDQLTNAS